MRRPGGLVLALLMCSGALPLFVSPASAVPAFARRYGVACSTCHDAWPHLNPTGMSFKMSGYRRLNGADLQPTTKDMELAVGALQIPSIPPLAIRLTTGFDWRRDHRTASDGSRAGQTGSSLDLEDVDIFLATPLGKHLSKPRTARPGRPRPTTRVSRPAVTSSSRPRARLSRWAS